MAVTIPIISEFNNKGTKQAESALGGLTKSAKVAGAAVAAGFVAIGAGLTMAVKAAAEDQASFQQLAVTLKNVTGASDQLAASVDKTLGKMAMSSGIADDKLRPALSNLVRATGDLRLSQGALSSVMDLSVAKQIDMESASAAVGKALAGNTTALVKMLPGLRGVIDNGSSAAEVLEAINSQVGGASAAQADTFAGKVARLKIVFDELVETVGSWLLPLLSSLGDFVLSKVVPAFQYVSDVIGPKVEQVMGRIGEVVSNDLAPAFEWWGGLLRERIIPVITALAKLFGENLSKIFDVVREKVNANRESFIQMRDGVETVWRVFQDKALPILLKVGDFMGTVGAKAIGVFIDAIIKLGGAIAQVAGTVARVWGGMTDAIIKGVNFAIDAINALIRGWNAIPRWARGIYGGDISLIPNVSGSTGGGTTSGGPSSFLAGNVAAAAPSVAAGAFVPPSMGAVTGGTSGGRSGGTGPSAGGSGPSAASLGFALDLSNYQPPADFLAGVDPFGGMGFNINVNGGLATSAEIGAAVVDAIKQYTNVSGPADIRVA
jgi:hypothetical protein